jgi:hypothetical protein
VKEASATVAALARRFGVLFMGFVPTVLPAMLRVLKSNKGVMYASANEAIVEICDNCCVEGLVLALCAASDDKHPSVREHVMRFIARMLANSNGAPLSDAATDAVEASLRRAVVDGSAPVRVEAKSAFSSFKRAYPVEAALLLASLDAAVQKKLESGVVAAVNSGVSAAALSNAAAAAAAPFSSSASSSVAATPLISMDNARERILKARLNVAVVPLSGVVWETLPEDPSDSLRESTPPKSGFAEGAPTPELPEATRAKMVHYLKQPPQTECPQSTPARGVEETKNEAGVSPSFALLQEVSASLRAECIPGDPHPTPDKGSGSRKKTNSSPGALLLQAALCLQVSQMQPDTAQKAEEVKLPVVLAEKPTFESVKKAKKVRKPQRAQKENGATESSKTKAATVANKDSTPIAKRTRNRKVSAPTRVK